MVEHSGEMMIGVVAEAAVSSGRLKNVLICQSFNQVDDFRIANVASEAADDIVGLNGDVVARRLAADDGVPVPPKPDIEVVRMIFIMEPLFFQIMKQFVQIFQVAQDAAC